MIKENTKYTYGELREIFNEAQVKAMRILAEEMDKAREEAGKGNDMMRDFAFTMQNLMAMQTLERVLLGKES